MKKNINTLTQSSHSYLRGFSLTEILVVVAIIGILASVITISTNSARQKSRDVKRKADMETLAGALELYYSENKEYPEGDFASGQLSGLSSFIVPDYLSQMPVDPKEGEEDGKAQSTGYYYSSDGSTYAICTMLARDTGASGEGSSGPYYCVGSVGCGDPVLSGTKPTCSE